MTTDASLEGWAAVIGDAAFSGTWDECDGDDIALLELNAVLLGLQAFFLEPAPLTIHLSTDNTVTKAYVNHMGDEFGIMTPLHAAFGDFLKSVTCSWSRFSFLRKKIARMFSRVWGFHAVLTALLPQSSNFYLSGFVQLALPSRSFQLSIGSRVMQQLSCRVFAPGSRPLTPHC